MSRRASRGHLGRTRTGSNNTKKPVEGVMAKYREQIELEARLNTFLK